VLTYNIFIFIVAVLLAMDYYVHKYDVDFVNGGTRVSFGNSFIYVALVVIIFFAGFRFEIGDDYPKYLAGYMYDSQLVKWEPFFNFFVRITRDINFGIGIQFMFLFFSTITILIIYKALRSLTPYYRFAILLYLLTPSLFLNSFSVIRQGIALAILLYGMQYIGKEESEYRKYAIVAFFAFMFHYSSIFVVATYILGTKFFQRTQSWLVYVVLIFVSYFLSFAHIGKIVLANMPGHFSFYANNLGYTVSPLKLFLVNAFFLFFMFQKDKFIKTKLDRYLLNSVFVGLLIFNIFSDFVFVSRLAQYFLVTQIILVPIYLFSIKDILIRKTLFVIFIVYFLFDFNHALYRVEKLHNASASKNLNALIPYRNYFTEEKKSYRTQNIEAWYDYILEVTEKEAEEAK